MASQPPPPGHHQQQLFSNTGFVRPSFAPPQAPMNGPASGPSSVSEAGNSFAGFPLPPRPGYTADSATKNVPSIPQWARPPIPGQGSAFSPLQSNIAAQPVLQQQAIQTPAYSSNMGISPKPPPSNTVMGRPPSTPVTSPTSSGKLISYNTQFLCINAGFLLNILLEPPSNHTSQNPSPTPTQFSSSRFDHLEGQFLPGSGATSKLYFLFTNYCIFTNLVHYRSSC
jgi:hypothetical protein